MYTQEDFDAFLKTAPVIDLPGWLQGIEDTGADSSDPNAAMEASIALLGSIAFSCVRSEELGSVLWTVEVMPNG